MALWWKYLCIGDGGEGASTELSHYRWADGCVSLLTVAWRLWCGVIGGHKAVAARRRKLFHGGCNGEDRGTLTEMDLRLQIWRCGSGNGAVVAIFTWRISGSGDNLAVSSGIAVAVAVVIWRLRRDGSGCGTASAMVKTVVRRWR